MNDKRIQAYLADCFKSSKIRKTVMASLVVFLSGGIRLASLIPTKVGRQSISCLPRHGIKRIHRLFKNPLLTKKIMDQILATQMRRWFENTPKVVLAIDWTTIREKFMFCSVSLVLGSGRSVPLYQTSYVKRELNDTSQNKLEEEALRFVLKEIQPDVKVVILADRGFDRPMFLRWIRGLGHDFVIRASKGSKIRKNNGIWRKLGPHLIQRGRRRVMRKILYTQADKEPCSLAVLWNRDQKEPWLLLTSLDGASATEIGNLYAMRMEIEEMFRSLKNEQQGFDIKKVRLRHLDRWMRLWFASVLLFQFLATIGGAMAQFEKLAKAFTMCSKIPPKQRAVFSIYTLACLCLNSILVKIRVLRRGLMVRLPSLEPQMPWIRVG